MEFSIAYLCAKCGGPAYGPANCLSIDTGTTFTCEACGDRTVVSLMTVEEYWQHTTRGRVNASCRTGHQWENVGGRSCPRSRHIFECSQPVFQCRVCGEYDYGEKGGPGATICDGCEEIAKFWNARFPVGTKVKYHPIIDREEGAIVSETRSEAWTMGGGHPVVLIKGRTGGVSLEALEIL